MVRQWSGPEEALNRLLRRCVECPKNVRPTCPDCSKDHTCTMVPQSCDACAFATCVKTVTYPGQAAPKSTAPIGGIIGGVVGGVVVVLALTFLIWRFCIRKQKRQDLWEPPEKTPEARSDLTRTNSIASTVMTRASNVIQIAYIPGVTVRSAPESPEIPPPMPSIPSTYAGTSNHTTPDVEQHFFMPRDLRDSVWSDTSSMMTDQRVSIAPSLARDTIYQEHASMPPIPIQYAFRAQANAVSVRSGSSTPSIGQNDGATPPMPQVQRAVNVKGSSIVARNVVARPIEVKKMGASQSAGNLSVFPRKAPSRRLTPVPAISDEKEVVISSPASTNPSESPSLSSSGSAIQPAEGALGSGNVSSVRPTTAYAEAMIYEAMLRATQDSSHTGSGLTVQRPELKKHDSGPFSDANEIK